MGILGEEFKPQLASKDEILAYCRQVMIDLLSTGRVTYFPKCRTKAMCKNPSTGELEDPRDGLPSDGLVHFTHVLDPDQSWSCRVRRKVVDSTYMEVKVPSTVKANFHVASGVHFVTPNQLQSLREGGPEFVVCGAGKTGLDVVLYLLRQGVQPKNLVWVMPRSSWYLQRDSLDPLKRAVSYKIFSESKDAIDVLLRMEEAGFLLRFDDDNSSKKQKREEGEHHGLTFADIPKVFRCATIDRAEHAILRRYRAEAPKNFLVNCGRISEIAEPGRVVLSSGKEIRTGPGTVYVNCTASAFNTPWTSKIFEDDKKLIRLQCTALCQVTPSASLLGYVETQFHKGKLTEEERALVSTPAPIPDTAEEACLCFERSLRNTSTLLSGPTKNLSRITRWTLTNRLFAISRMGWGSFFKLAKEKKKNAQLAKLGLKRLQEINGTEDGKLTQGLRPWDGVNKAWRNEDDEKFSVLQKNAEIAEKIRKDNQRNVLV